MDQSIEPQVDLLSHCDQDEQAHIYLRKLKFQFHSRSDPAVLDSDNILFLLEKFKRRFLVETSIVMHVCGAAVIATELAF